MCSQCQSSQLECRYMEGGKRGIPAAYITSLERRLVETEAALYAVLAATDTTSNSSAFDQLGLQTDSTTSKLQDRSKLERQEEWKRLPLHSGKQLVEWFLEKKVQEEYALSSITRHQVSGTEESESRQNSATKHIGTALQPSLASAEIRSSHNPTDSDLSARPEVCAQWRNYF